MFIVYALYFSASVYIFSVVWVGCLFFVLMKVRWKLRKWNENEIWDFDVFIEKHFLASDTFTKSTLWNLETYTAEYSGILDNAKW